MKKRIFKAMWLSVMAVAVVTVSSCSSDSDFFGLDGLEDFKSTHISTKSGLVDISEYLDISTCNSEKWTENDYISIDKAIQRMGISFLESKNQYVIDFRNAEDINVSDTLFNLIESMFEHSNAIFKESSDKLLRVKTRCIESVMTIPNCVPAAISSMGKDAPLYSVVISRCDELYPNWRNSGGVPGYAVHGLINEYTTVVQYTDMGFCGPSNTSLNNIVMLINSSHAVNAYSCSKMGTTLIYYHDNSSTSRGDGLVFESQVNAIFPFFSDIIF